LLPILGIEPHKNIENRSWPTNYRGPVLIHASLKIDKQPCVDHGLDPTKLETGGVVGIAKIVDCVTTHRSRWFEGPYGFVLKNRRGLPFVRWTGANSSNSVQQPFWRVPQTQSVGTNCFAAR